MYFHNYHSLLSLSLSLCLSSVEQQINYMVVLSHRKALVLSSNTLGACVVLESD